MKLSLVKSSGLAVLVAGMFVGSAFAGIAGTRHDLSGGAAGGSTFTPVGTAELCVFCHTPHAADTGATKPPLWNRDTSALAGYTMYNSVNSTTIDGFVAANPQGSISIACLSCHDGTVAIDTVINAPGSGFNAAWSGVGSSWASVSGAVDIGTGQMAVGASTNLGQDLRNDHPISIQYAGGPLTTAAALLTPGDDYTNLEFKDAAFKLAKSSGNNWWIDTGTVPLTRDKGDLVMYSRIDSGSAWALANPGLSEPFVECATCHDPHGTANATFLRVANTGSTLCLACHDK